MGTHEDGLHEQMGEDIGRRVYRSTVARGVRSSQPLDARLSDRLIRRYPGVSLRDFAKLLRGALRGYRSEAHKHNRNRDA